MYKRVAFVELFMPKPELKLMQETERRDMLLGVFESHVGPEGPLRCPILQDTINVLSDATVLPCSHVFDRDGIIQHLRGDQHACPACRTRVSSLPAGVDGDVFQEETPPLSPYQLLQQMGADYRSPYNPLTLGQHTMYRNLDSPDLSLECFFEDLRSLGATEEEIVEKLLRGRLPMCEDAGELFTLLEHNAVTELSGAQARLIFHLFQDPPGYLSWDVGIILVEYASLSVLERFQCLKQLLKEYDMAHMVVHIAQLDDAVLLRCVPIPSESSDHARRALFKWTLSHFSSPSEQFALLQSPAFPQDIATEVVEQQLRREKADDEDNYDFQLSQLNWLMHPLAHLRTVLELGERLINFDRCRFKDVFDELPCSVSVRSALAVSALYGQNVRNADDMELLLPDDFLLYGSIPKHSLMLVAEIAYFKRNGSALLLSSTNDEEKATIEQAIYHYSNQSLIEIITNLSQ